MNHAVRTQFEFVDGLCVFFFDNFPAKNQTKLIDWDLGRFAGDFSQVGGGDVLCN